MVTEIHSFAPIIDQGAKQLILGTMPGKPSLQAEEYYANPRNAFWPIMEALFAIDRGLPYCQRLQALKQQQIAVWDVLKSCQRKSSLDADIIGDSIIVNDFTSLFNHYRQIETVYFNGQKAEQYFSKMVIGKAKLSIGAIKLIRLPSTSPAHAAMSLADKTAAWSVLVR